MLRKYELTNRGVVDKDFPMICMIFRYSWGAMIFTKIPLSYENHLSTCRGWDFNKKIGTGSIFLIGPTYTTFKLERDGPTDRPTYRPTRQGVESRARD